MSTNTLEQLKHAQAALHAERNLFPKFRML